jgi:hypothetical protein
MIWFAYAFAAYVELRLQFAGAHDSETVFGSFMFHSDPGLISRRSRGS